MLHLSCDSKDGLSDHLTHVIMNSLVVEGGLTHEEIACKLVCFGSDGVATFQSVHNGVATQIHEKWGPFSLAANCDSHRTNLAVQIMSKYSMVVHLENLFGHIYSYKKVMLSFRRWLISWRLRVTRCLGMYKTRWISMRSLAKHVFSEYKTLMVKMGVDMTPAIDHKVPTGAKENFDLLADVEVLLPLACFIPLLDDVYHLMKLSQERDIFICDFMQAVKMCQGKLARRFIDKPSTYSIDDFPNIMILCR